MSRFVSMREPKNLLLRDSPTHSILFRCGSQFLSHKEKPLWPPGEPSSSDHVSLPKEKASNSFSSPLAGRWDEEVGRETS